MDDQLEPGAILGKEGVDCIAVPNLGVDRPEAVAVGIEEPLGLWAGRGFGAEEVRAHVVLEPDHVEACLDQMGHRLRADEAPGSGHDGAPHDASDAISFPIRRGRQNGAIGAGK